MSRAIVALVLFTGVVALAVYLYVGRPLPLTGERIPALNKLVAEQEEESAQAVANYRPSNKARIDDLDVSVVDLLRQLPGVVQVEVSVAAEKPTHRIVHLRDWHFVSKDLYAIDMKAAHGRELTAEEIDRLHQELLLEVEAVQLEQMALLRCLIKHHGLKRIFSEGLAAKDLPEYRKRIAVLRNMEQNQISELRKQLADVREMMKGKTGHEQAKKIEMEITGMIDQHPAQLLELGAPGRLLMAGPVLPY